MNCEFALASSELEKTAIAKQIDTMDSEIDHLIYNLYLLTNEEISLIEHYYS